MSKCLLQTWRMLHQPRVHITVEPVLLVFMFAQFLSYSALQVFVHDRLCEANNCTTPHSNNSSDPCGNISDAVQRKVQEETSHWLLYINIATGTPAILLSVFYGGISDVAGRRLFIALPTLGGIFNTAIVLVVMLVPDTSLYILLAGAAVTGICGNYSVLNFSAYSYASDVSAVSGRTRKIGVLESMTYLGATLSLLVGGVWVQKTESFLGPFWCILGCYVLVLLYTVFALPESLDLNAYSRRSRSSGHIQYFDANNKRCFMLGQCAVSVKMIGSNMVQFLKFLFTNWKLAVLVVTFFVVEINFLGITDVVIIYSLGKPLCWGFDLIGYFLAAKVFMNGVACLIVLPILAYLKLHDAIIVLMGLVSGAAALVTMGVATQSWTMYLVPLIGALRGCVVPCLRSMLSKVIPSDKLGVLFSGVGVIEAVCTLLASVIYNALFPITVAIHPGLCFFIMAAALTLPFLLILVLHLYRERTGYCCSSVRCNNQETPDRKPLLASTG